jgi:hypothetical protein
MFKYKYTHSIAKKKSIAITQHSGLTMTLEENMVKKKHNRLSIAILLTTLICTCKMITIFFFFDLPTEVLGIWGLLIYRWKSLEIPFQRCITCSQNLKITIVKQKRKICNHLVTADQGGQKNRNGNDYVSFLPCFLLV